MFNFFQRKMAVTTVKLSSARPELPQGMYHPATATALLDTPRRQKLLEHIWQRTSLSRQQFTSLYLAPLERYAELVQLFPASESHHHAYPGGMLDHGLEIVGYALKLRQSYLLPAGSTPEAQAAQAEAWTACIAYAALLHDLGKIAVDLHVETVDGKVWHPWHGALDQPYQFRYRQDREYRLHSAASGLLYTRVLDRTTLDWLSNYRDLWSSLLYVLAGQYEHAGILGELVIKADQASVALALGGDPGKALTAPRHALQRKLLEGLRYLLREEIKLNQPQASDGWLTEDALWLVSKTVSDKLRAHLLSQGIEGIPTSNTAVFNVLQEHGMLQPTATGKAIWRATITSSAGWSHSFTLLRLSPALIWEADERPSPFAGTVIVDPEEAQTPAGASPSLFSVEQEVAMPPVSITAIGEGVPDMMEDLLSILVPGGETPLSPATHSTRTNSSAPIDVLAVPDSEPTAATASIPSKAPPPSGDHFITWLRQSVQSHKLIINDAKALVHTVADTVYLVSPGIFQRYAQEHPAVSSLAKAASVQDWVWVQKQFERLRLHRKQKNGLNIWTCQVTGPRKTRRVHGYLLADPSNILPEVSFDNPYLTLLSETDTLSTQVQYTEGAIIKPS